ncbi:unnamed protein product [Discula destructiva]
MKSAVVLSLAAGALAAPAVVPKAPAASLSKAAMAKKHLLTRSDGRANVPAILASLNGTLAKWGSSPLPYYAPVAEQQAAQASERRMAKAKRQANEPLVDQYEGTSEDAAYYGAVVIGAGDGAPQTFELIFDTGSSDLWVPGQSCGLTDGCTHPFLPKYDEGGLSLGTNTSIEYGSGSTQGANWIDDVTVAGLTSANQTLFAVTSAVGFEELDAQGIIGMAFSTIAQDNGTTFFESLIAAGSVDANEFGVYLGRVASGTEEDSELTLGGRDSTKVTGDFVTVPVSSETYWQVAIDRVTVNGKTGGISTPGQAAIDTGTTLWVAPTTAAKEIMAKVPNALGFPLEGEVLYIYPCNTSAEYIPALEFAGESFPINPLDFNLGAIESEDIVMLALGNQTLVDEMAAANVTSELANFCIAGMAGLDLYADENLYIVGDTFIKNWYTVFSYDASNGEPAVLFAPSVAQDS